MKSFKFGHLIVFSAFFLLLLPSSATPSYQVFSIFLSGVAPYYSPAHANAVTGQPIQWVNSTSSPHTITHVNCLENTTCAFDSGPLQADAKFSIYSLPPGVYPYFCRLHPIMRGTLIVLSPSNETNAVNLSAIRVNAR